MNSDIANRVRVLAAQCQDLTQGIRRLARSDEPSSSVEERLRKALVHVELALEAIERRADASVSSTPGRFLARFSGMVERMVGGSTSSHRSDLHMKLAGSIASLRQARGRQRTGGIHGNSSTISIPDFLGFLQVQGKTGLLQISLPSERITMHVSRGDLVEAFSDNSPISARLGEILVEQKALDRKSLDAFFVYHTKNQGRLGRALEVHELVTEEQLRSALTEQVVRMVQRILAAADAPFVFHEGRIDETTIDFRLGVVELLLESARQADEARWTDDGEPAAALPSEGTPPSDDADGEQPGRSGGTPEEFDLDELRARINKLSE